MTWFMSIIVLLLCYLLLFCYVISKIVLIPLSRNFEDFYRATEEGHLWRVRELVEGKTPLYDASSNDHLAVVKYFVEQHSMKEWILYTIPSWILLLCFFVPKLAVFWLIAIAWNKLSQKFPSFTRNLSYVQAFLERNVVLAEKVLITLDITPFQFKCDKHGRTPVYAASLNGHLDVVRYLVEKWSLQKDKAARDGSTPLIIASKYGHLGVVRYLLEKGVKDRTLKDGMTGFLYAVQEGHVDVVRCLAEQGADIEKADESGWTPLIYASLHGQLDVVSYLLEQGANRDKADNALWTPLHCAAYCGHLEVAKLLMVYGADLNARTSKGELPIDFAFREHEGIVQAILDEPKRRMDAAPGKRATEQDQHPNADTSASAQGEETQPSERVLPEGELADEDEDSEPSSDENDD